jgi:hypothetical protein
MTSDIERTRREMWDRLRETKVFCDTSMEVIIGSFEEALELHLETLRQEKVGLRNKLQAFQFANQSAGELLRDAMATVKRQREFIRTLYTSRKARKNKGSTSGRNSKENASCASCEGNAMMIVLAAVNDVQRIMVDWLVPDGIGSKKAMARMTEVLDNEPLCLAMDTFEKRDFHKAAKAADFQRQTDGFRSGSIGCNGQMSGRA